MPDESTKQNDTSEPQPSSRFAEDKATQTENPREAEAQKGAEMKDASGHDKQDVKKIVSFLEDVEKVLSPLSHLGTVAYYTCLNCLFAANLWVFVSVYRLF